MSVFVSPADESSKEEEEAREVIKEECELGVVKSWMEMGGIPVLAEEEMQGLLCEVYPFYLVWFSLSTHSINALFSEPDLCDGFHFFFFQGLDLLKGLVH